jgi:hypothetical protein
MVQPPPLSTPDPPPARRLVIKHIERDDSPSLDGRNKRGLIGQAKVLANPENGSGLVHAEAQRRGEEKVGSREDAKARRQP